MERGLQAGVLAVMIGGPTDGWPQALTVAQPIIESIRICDGTRGEAWCAPHG